MKNRTRLILCATTVFFCLLGAASSRKMTQAEERDGGRVTSAGIYPVNRVTTGHCPVKVAFTGRITTNGPAIVRYRVVQDDVGDVRSESEERTLVFRQAGSQSVSYSLTPAQSMNSWIALHIIAPNEMETSHAGFDVKCQR